MSERKFSELSEEEKKIVKKHYDDCMSDETMECSKLHSSIVDFWESHKMMDYPDW